MYRICRTHVLPDNVGAERVVQCKYMQSSPVLMTSFEMDRFIRRRWKRHDVWTSYDFYIPMKTYCDVLQAIHSDSMDQYWLDMKPSTVQYTVEGTFTQIESTCPICKERTRDKIRVSPCGCVFHRKCIETSVKYRDTCPVCMSTIYKYPICNQICNSEEKSENDIIVSVQI